MSHYFYNNVFDYVDPSGQFGYSIEQIPGMQPSSSVGVEENDYVVEVHYMGGPATTMFLDVSNIQSDSGDAPTVSYVQKGVHENYAQFPEATFMVNGLQDGETTDGLTEWSGEASSLDPHYGVVAAHIPVQSSEDDSSGGPGDGLPDGPDGPDGPSSPPIINNPIMFEVYGGAGPQMIEFNYDPSFMLINDTGLFGDEAGAPIPVYASSDGYYIIQSPDGGFQTIYSNSSGGIPSSGSSASDMYYGAWPNLAPLSDLSTDTSGMSSRDHEYLYMESTLYFDVIQKDSFLVSSFQDLLDGTTSLGDFSSLLSGNPPYMTAASHTDASNDIYEETMYIQQLDITVPTGDYNLDMMPGMYHFDNNKYNDIDLSLTDLDQMLNTILIDMSNVNEGPSETTLVGEFRIDGDLADDWSFDTNFRFKLNDDPSTFDQDIYSTFNGVLYDHFETSTFQTGDKLDISTTITKKADGNLSFEGPTDGGHSHGDDDSSDGSQSGPDMSSVNIYIKSDLGAWTDIADDGGYTAIWDENGTAMALNVEYGGNAEYIVPAGETPYPVPFNGGDLTNIESESVYATIDLSNFGNNNGGDSTWYSTSYTIDDIAVFADNPDAFGASKFAIQVIDDKGTPDNTADDEFIYSVLVNSDNSVINTHSAIPMSKDGIWLQGQSEAHAFDQGSDDHHDDHNNNGVGTIVDANVMSVSDGSADFPVSVMNTTALGDHLVVHLNTNGIQETLPLIRPDGSHLTRGDLATLNWSTSMVFQEVGPDEGQMGPGNLAYYVAINYSTPGNAPTGPNDGSGGGHDDVTGLNVYIFTEADASNINGMPTFNGAVTAGTAYMFDKGDRDALLVEVVLNDITSEPTDDYIVVDDGGAVIGLKDGIPEDAIDGLKFYLEGTPDGTGGLTPVGFVPVGDAGGDEDRHDDSSQEDQGVPVFFGGDADPDGSHGAIPEQKYAIILNSDGSGQLIPVTFDTGTWTADPTGIINVDSGLQMPDMSKIMGNYTPSTDHHDDDDHEDGGHDDGAPIVGANEIGFTNVVPDVNFGTVVMDVVLPADINNLTGLHIDLNSVIGTTTPEGINGVTINSYRGSSSYIVVDQGELHTNSWNGGPVLRLNFTSVDSDILEGGPEGIISSLIDETYIQTYSDDGWITVTSIGHVGDGSGGDDHHEVISMPVFYGGDIIDSSSVDANLIDVNSTYIILLDPANDGSGELIPISGAHYDTHTEWTEDSDNSIYFSSGLQIPFFDSYSAVQPVGFYTPSTDHHDDGSGGGSGGDAGGGTQQAELPYFNLNQYEANLYASPIKDYLSTEGQSGGNFAIATKADGTGEAIPLEGSDADGHTPIADVAPIQLTADMVTAIYGNLTQIGTISVTQGDGDQQDHEDDNAPVVNEQQYWPNPNIDGSDAVTYAEQEVVHQGGSVYELDSEAELDYSLPNAIDTSLGGFVDGIVQAGLGNDYITGGVGGYTVDGGEGFDVFINTTAALETVRDAEENIIDMNGIIVDLSASRVTYLGSDSADIVENTEYFLGTTADDIFVGASRYESQYSIQAFNPSGGRDEIFGAEDSVSPTGELKEVITAVDYSAMQGGQGAVFILDGNSNIINGEVPYSSETITNIDAQVGGDWNNWLPAAEWVLNQGSEPGFISTTSEFDTEKDGATVILDTFGYVDLGFNIDHYIGSSESDLFLGASEDDVFDAGMGVQNIMIGGQGQDELIVSDSNSHDDNIDLSSISVRSLYSHQNFEQVDINAGEFVSGTDVNVTGQYYRIDFADVSDLSTFIGDNLSSTVASKYSVTTDYALFLVSDQDLTSLSPSVFTYDNGKIEVIGTTDISILESLPGELMLAEETIVEGRFIIEGTEKDGDAYSTIIEDVEKVTLTTNDVQYIGTENLSGSQEDSYELLIGGQGDLGDMLYVATGQTLDSTTGVAPYSVNANFITGEIYYSGNHVDFDRSSSVNGWANSIAAAYTTIEDIEQAKIWNNETAEFFVWYDADGADGAAEGYEIAVKFQNGNINAWGIDNRQFDTFQNVVLDQSTAEAIKLQFGETLNVDLGSYRVLYEAAFSDIETIISSDNDVSNWNFDFVPDSSRSTFYIQVGGEATGENGNSGVTNANLVNVKVERIVDGDGFKWSINPDAEILVNMPVIAGATEAADVMISGDTAETIEAGKGSDVMMGRGGSDNYKINQGDTIQVDESGEVVAGDYGVAGDVINEIGGSSDDKSDSITLSSAQSIDQLSFSRTQIKNEEWSNTLRIDVDYDGDATIDDTLYVFDHYNENLGFRAVEKLFLDDGWDTDEIWNLVVGDTDTNGVDTYNGSSGQDVLIAGLASSSTLYGGDGKDIMIGDSNELIEGESYSKSTTFELGNKDGEWDQIADIIQGFGDGDELDLSALGIEDSSSLSVDGDNLVAEMNESSVTIAEFKDFNDGLTLEQLLTEEGSIIYANVS